MTIEYNSPLYWAFSALFILGLLGGLWFVGRFMVRFDHRRKRRLEVRYNIEIRYGPSAVWMISKESLAGYHGNKLRLRAIVAATQLSIWIGFSVMLCLGIAVLIAVLSSIELRTAAAPSRLR